MILGFKARVLPVGVGYAGRARRRLSVIQVEKIDVNVTDFVESSIQMV